LRGLFGSKPIHGVAIAEGKKAEEVESLSTPNRLTKIVVKIPASALHAIRQQRSGEPVAERPGKRSLS